MIFLKKFNAVGFKSFANPIDLLFNNSMIGIVGPNGSGKSNIVDAIKWVMGEKSNKTLRGKIGSDVIFHGSKDKDGSQYAMVSLTFDNKNKILHTDLEEVTITRKLSRDSNVNEYFINNEPCKLKEIYDLFLDTGLAKGSLGIISQGTVQWFVDAKPEERRKIFEDSAGIGLYTKRKAESLSELATATENLNRANDYVKLLEKDINKLSKQVEKAQVYNEKRKQLKDLELTILAKDLSINQARLIKLREELEAANTSISEKDVESETLKKQIVFAKEKADSFDQIVEEYSEKFSNLVQEINRLEIQNNNLINKLNDDLSSDNIQKKIAAYKQIISTYEFDLKSTTEANKQLQIELDSYENVRQDFVRKNENMSASFSTLASQINDLQYQLKFINEKINNEFNSEIGVKTILENRTILKGIIGVVKNYLEVEPQYEKAISIALGKTANYLISENEEDVKYAIEFLKSNKSGKATFLPLNIVKPRKIRTEHELILNQLDGFIDTANHLIKFDAKYENVFGMLLGTVLVCQDLNSAINIAKYTNSAYPIVTLDGETIAPGGSITGGYSKTFLNSLFNLQEKKEETIKQLEELSKEYAIDKEEIYKLESNLNDINLKINEKKIIFSTNSEKIKNIENNLFRYKSEFENFSSKDSKSKTTATIDDVTKKLAELNAKKDAIIQKLNVAKTTKATNKQIYEDYQARLEDLRSVIDKQRDIQTQAEVDLTRTQAVIENAKNIIGSTYKMTVENAIKNYNKELPMTENQARQLIIELKHELDRIGNINMEALSELETKKKEFETISVQHKELQEAKDKIVKAIAELDANAKKNFQETIDKVNKELPYVFGYLFGGGTCSVQYTNPDDILNSGIDVMAIPPGKKVTNLNLLSGGEKTMVALTVLFAILRIHSFPLVILDEAESALDPANVERFGNIIRKSSCATQFIVITHRPGTMERCDSLFGATMQIKGITNMYKVTLDHAKSEYGKDDNK